MGTSDDGNDRRDERPALTLVRGHAPVKRLVPADGRRAEPVGTDPVGTHLEALRRIAAALARTLETLTHAVTLEDASYVAHAVAQMRFEAGQVQSLALRDAVQRAVGQCRGVVVTPGHRTPFGDVMLALVQLEGVRVGCEVLEEQLVGSPERR